MFEDRPAWSANRTAAEEAKRKKDELKAKRNKELRDLEGRKKDRRWRRTAGEIVDSDEEEEAANVDEQDGENEDEEEETNGLEVPRPASRPGASFPSTVPAAVPPPSREGEEAEEADPWLVDSPPGLPRHENPRSPATRSGLPELGRGSSSFQTGQALLPGMTFLTLPAPGDVVPAAAGPISQPPRATTSVP